MWNMTSFGILMPSIRPAHTIDEGDDRLLQIRTRRAHELDILREKYLPELGETIATPNMDYNFRAYCTHEQYAEAMRLMILDIDYAKFKPTTEDLYKDKELHGVYNSIWGTVCRLGKPGGIWADWEKSYRTRGARLAGTGVQQPTLAQRFAQEEPDTNAVALRKEIEDLWNEADVEITPLKKEKDRQRRWSLDRLRGKGKNRGYSVVYDDGWAEGYDEGYSDGYDDGVYNTDYGTSSSDDVKDGDALWRDIKAEAEPTLAALAAQEDVRTEEEIAVEANRLHRLAAKRGAILFPDEVSSEDATVGGPL